MLAVPPVAVTFKKDAQTLKLATKCLRPEPAQLPYTMFVEPTPAPESYPPDHPRSHDPPSPLTLACNMCPPAVATAEADAEVRNGECTEVVLHTDGRC